ncbi:MAG: hypothetical protein ABSF03_32130, partial [Streptosporangiaceae bacterium]
GDAPAYGAGPAHGGAPANDAVTAHNESRQQLWAAALQNDKLSLDRGALTYTPIRKLKADASSNFQVVVTDLGKGAGYQVVDTANGMTVFQQDIPTGGNVGIRVVNSSDVTCEAESSTVQPILAKGETATWWWRITAGMPGPAAVTLEVNTYDQDSEQILSEEHVHATGTVQPTTASKRQQTNEVIGSVTHSGVNIIETIGTLAGSITAVAGIAGAIFAWRRQRKRVSDGRLSEAQSQQEAPLHSNAGAVSHPDQLPSDRAAGGSSATGDAEPVAADE